MILPRRNSSLRGDNSIKKLLFGTVAVLIVSAAVKVFLSVESMPGHEELRTYLSQRLIAVQPLPEARPSEALRSHTVIYVLGGSEFSLKGRLETVAQLYHQGIGDRIVVLRRPGITGYDLDLQRNLTNDEWAVKQLAARGISREALEFVSLKGDCFGTLAEAEAVSALAVKRNYSRVVLVTSQCHTKRTWLTFSRALMSRKSAVAIYGSAEPVGLKGVLSEFGKLLLYKYILLPTYAIQNAMVPASFESAPAP